MSVALPLILSILIVVGLGPIVIPKLKEMKFGQTIRTEGPQSHLAKNGTPTMGGVMIIASILITTLIFAGVNFFTLIALVSTLGFGLVGFLDDYIKVVKKRSLGLTPKQKIFGQVTLAILIPLAQVIFKPEMTKLVIPFFESTLDLGLLYVPFMAFVIIGTVNAVNLTDGLDGLSSSITVVVSIFFIAISMMAGITEVSIFSASVMGACLGFLVFNKYPAKVFMGDTGSMALGGAVIGMATLTNMTLLIPIIGGIYFAEALSVIIQVVSFKTRQKRVFKMAPLHHHFEQCGWKETKVVKNFCLTAVLLLGVAFLSLM